MDKKFLKKVLDQIVSETRIDYDNERVYVPFYFAHTQWLHLDSVLSCTPRINYLFSKHCEEVYGLDKQEIEYVREEYIKIIKDKYNQWIRNF